MKKYLLIIIAFMSFGLTACPDTNDVEYLTYEIEESDVFDLSGYYWFQESYNEYQAKGDIITQISEEFNPEKDKLIFYFTRRCDCDTPYHEMAQMLKTTTLASIPDSCKEFFVVPYAHSDHPYVETIDLTKYKDIDSPDYLDRVFLINSNTNQVQYAIMDTVQKMKSESNNNIFVEDLLLEALK